MRVANGRLRRGWRRDALSLYGEAGPTLSHDVVPPRPNAKRFRANPCYQTHVKNLFSIKGEQQRARTAGEIAREAGGETAAGEQRGRGRRLVEPDLDRRQPARAKQARQLR